MKLMTIAVATSGLLSAPVFAQAPPQTNPPADHWSGTSRFSNLNFQLHRQDGYRGYV
jgi:hypothetical protein